MKFDIGTLLENNAEKVQVSLKSDKNNGYSTVDIFTFMISRLILPRLRSISHKFVQNITHAFYAQ